MAVFPEVQKKAHAELDRVVGPNRHPEFDDIDKMPYIQAIIMETMRFIPVVPFGVPHMNIEDDMFNGYYIPKGTTLVAVS